MLGGVGILIEPGSYHSLAEGILKALQDKGLRRNLERAVRQRAERKYNWPKTASSLLMAYEKILVKNENNFYNTRRL
jgi:glycosyltransferase involved in cell wall biosynthesis